MSTGPRTQAAYSQGNQSSVEHDASHSALVYLFQEVSKLAGPIHNSLLDAKSPSTWLNETSRQGPFIVKNEDTDASFQISDIPCQHTLSCISPYKQMKKVPEESHSSRVTTLAEPYPERNSPWKVLSLINLQCERLLHHSDVEERDPSSAPSVTKSGYLKDSGSIATATEEGVGGDRIRDECTLRSSVIINEREDIPARFSPVEAKRVCIGGVGMRDDNMGCFVQTQMSDDVRSGLVEETATLSSKPDHRDKREDKFGVNRHFEWKQDCLSSEQDNLNVPFFKNALSQTHNTNASTDCLLTCSSNEDACVALSLDHNANFALTPCDNQLHPVDSVLPSSQSVSLLTGKFTASKPESTQAPIQELSPPVVQLKASISNRETNPSPSVPSQPEPGAVLKEDITPSCTQQWRTKTPRKQLHPSRSADILDPDFQGVTFRMDTELDDSREQCRLLITSEYSKELCKSVRKPRLRTRTSQRSFKTSSSDEESDPTTSVSKGKVCASCCTRKTPMWRDAEDGTPLCNACGIRYKKYRVRCVNCWHIPRKEGNTNSCCLKCGNFVKLTSAQRKYTT